MGFRYEARCELWLWTGKGAWHFVTLPTELTAPLKTVRGSGRAFGSMAVTATIGGSTWRTSLFPSGKADAFLLPVKADVRKAEKIVAGDMVDVVVEIGL